MYLIFTTEEAALERADKQGKHDNYSYWTDGKKTRQLQQRHEALFWHNFYGCIGTFAAECSGA